MRKITLALLILLSTQCFAGKNLIEVYILQDGKLVNNIVNLNNGVPEKTALNKKYLVSYTYINQVAIPIQDFVPYFSDGFDVLSNDCPRTLPVGGMCSIATEYTPSKLGVNDVYLYLKEGLNTFYIPASTETSQYLGVSDIGLDAEKSNKFNTYYSSGFVADNKYVFKNYGENRAVIGSVDFENNPSDWIVDTCRNGALSPNDECAITFGGLVMSGVYNFKITINYDGKKYVYSETIVVGGDKKVMGCKIG